MMPARMRAASAGSAAAVRSSRMRAPRRRRRRERTAPVTRVEAALDGLGAAMAAMAAGSSGAARRMRAEALRSRLATTSRLVLASLSIGGKFGAATAGEAEGADLAAALGDAVGEGGGEERARVAVVSSSYLGARAEAFAILGGLAVDAAGGTTVDIGADRWPGRRGEGGCRPVVRPRPAERMGSRSSNSAARSAASACWAGVVAVSIMAARRGWAPRAAMLAAERRYFARIQGTQIGQEGGADGQGAGGRWVGEREVGGGGAPGGAVEHEAGEFGFEDLRAVEGRHAALGGRRPEADGGAGSLASGAARALVGSGAADAEGRQAGQAGGGVHARNAPPAAVDDDADARDREGSFGDAGRQHDPAALGGAEGTVLLGGGEIAVEREDQGAAIRQRGFGAADLAHAGEERRGGRRRARPKRCGWREPWRRGGRGDP